MMTPLSTTLLAGMLGLGLVACSSAAAREPEHRDADPWPLGSGGALDRTLLVGTLIQATIQGSPSWRRNQAGETLRASVSADVKNAHGWVVIPAGSPVGLTIGQRGAATNTRHPDGKMLLDVTSVTVWGQVYPVREVVVVAPGTRILFVLSEGFTASLAGGQAEAPSPPASK